MKTNKQKAALSSVYAAIFLTGSKTLVGIFTGSLGILSEAAHSGMDLFAALVTFFAVKYSDKPADAEHQYGHGKMESFSALVETLLLLATCGWIIYEAVEKLWFGKSTEVLGSQWGILLMAISIIVDYSRVKVLKKAAEEHHSQALEADALHFSSDILSSAVVIGGLACVWIGEYFKIPAMKMADPLAALGVSALVIKVSIELGKQTIDALLDKAPDGINDSVLKIVQQVDGVQEVGTIRVRPSGPSYFINISVGIDPQEPHRTVHSIVQEINETIAGQIPQSDVVVSTFPVGSEPAEPEVSNSVKRAIRGFTNCINAHDVHVYEVGNQKRVTAHIELKENITLKESHELSHHIRQAIQKELEGIEGVDIHFEYKEAQIPAEDITEQKPEIVEAIQNQVIQFPNIKGCHAIKLFSRGDQCSTFLHCELSDNITVDKLRVLSNNITDQLKQRIPCLENVYIHFEPFEAEPVSQE